MAVLHTEKTRGWAIGWNLVDAAKLYKKNCFWKACNRWTTLKVTQGHRKWRDLVVYSNNMYLASFSTYYHFYNVCHCRHHRYATLVMWHGMTWQCKSLPVTLRSPSFLTQQFTPCTLFHMWEQVRANTCYIFRGVRFTGLKYLKWKWHSRSLKVIGLGDIWQATWFPSFPLLLSLSCTISEILSLCLPKFTEVT